MTNRVQRKSQNQFIQTLFLQVQDLVMHHCSNNPTNFPSNNQNELQPTFALGTIKAITNTFSTTLTTTTTPTTTTTTTALSTTTMTTPTTTTTTQQRPFQQRQRPPLQQTQATLMLLMDQQNRNQGSPVNRWNKTTLHWLLGLISFSFMLWSRCFVVWT